MTVMPVSKTKTNILRQKDFRPKGRDLGLKNKLFFKNNTLKSLELEPNIYEIYLSDEYFCIGAHPNLAFQGYSMPV